MVESQDYPRSCEFENDLIQMPLPRLVGVGRLIRDERVRRPAVDVLCSFRVKGEG